MIKNIAKRIMHYFVMYPSTNRLIKTYIDIPILALCNNIAFGNSFFTFLKNSILKNKRTYTLISIIILTFSVFFSLGYKSSLTVIDYLKFNEKLILSKLSLTSSQLHAETNAKLNYKYRLYDIIYDPEYMRYTVFKEANIMIPREFNTDHLKLMFREADNNKLPYGIVFRLINKESRFIEGLTSPKGAKHYFQVMPRTKQIYKKILDLKVDDEVEENIIIGTRILRDLYDGYSKNYKEKEAWKLALAAYNAGQGNVEKYNGIPPFVETQDYVKYIIQGL